MKRYEKDLKYLLKLLEKNNLQGIYLSQTKLTKDNWLVLKTKGLVIDDTPTYEGEIRVIPTDKGRVYFKTERSKRPFVQFTTDCIKGIFIGIFTTLGTEAVLYGIYQLMTYFKR